MTRHTAPLRPDRAADLERRRIAPQPRSARVAGDEPAREDRIALAVAGIVWWTLLLVAASIAPEADGPAAEQLTALGELASLAQFAAIFGVVMLLVSGLRRGAGMAMLLGGGVFLASAVACVGSGHHAFGTWWYGQAAATVGMMLTGAATMRGGLRRRR